MPVDQQDEFDDAQWKPLEKRFEDDKGNSDGRALSGFFRDFLMREGRYVPPAATFESFERRYERNGFDAAALAAELNQEAQAYDVIRGVTPHPVPVVERALCRLRDLDSPTTYPLAMRLFKLFREQAATPDQLAGSLQLLASVILRRLICGESSRGYGMSFVRLDHAVAITPPNFPTVAGLGPLAGGPNVAAPPQVAVLDAFAYSLKRFNCGKVNHGLSGFSDLTAASASSTRPRRPRAETSRCSMVRVQPT